VAWIAIPCVAWFSRALGRAVRAMGSRGGGAGRAVQDSGGSSGSDQPLSGSAGTEQARRRSVRFHSRSRAAERGPGTTVTRTNGTTSGMCAATMSVTCSRTCAASASSEGPASLRSMMMSKSSASPGCRSSRPRVNRADDSTRYAPGVLPTAAPARTSAVLDRSARVKRGSRFVCSHTRPTSAATAMAASTVRPRALPRRCRDRWGPRTADGAPPSASSPSPARAAAFAPPAMPAAWWRWPPT
jgi:hypothetical protein